LIAMVLRGDYHQPVLPKGRRAVDNLSNSAPELLGFKIQG